MNRKELIFEQMGVLTLRKTVFYMEKHDKLPFSEEIKTYVKLAMNSIETRTLEEEKQYIDDYEDRCEETKR